MQLVARIVVGKLFVDIRPLSMALASLRDGDDKETYGVLVVVWDCSNGVSVDFEG